MLLYVCLRMVSFGVKILAIYVMLLSVVRGGGNIGN